MPIYEYGCDACGKVLEFMQKFSDEPLKTCPDCSGQLTKLISRTSFQFKGTGWYVTDYARKPESKSEGESKPAADAKSGSEPNAGAESKPAAESTGSGTGSGNGRKPSASGSKSEKTPSSPKR